MKIRDYILESSLSRMFKLLNDKKYTVGFISAYNEVLGIKENIERHKRLIKDVRSLGLGYIQLRSGYTYADSDDMTNEKSLMISNIDKDTLLKLSKRYDQESVLYSDENGFYLIGSNGNIIMTFAKNRDTFTFNNELIRKAFSSLIKGRHKNRKISFKMLEEKEPDSINRWYFIKEAKYVRIL